MPRIILKTYFHVADLPRILPAAPQPHRVFSLAEGFGDPRAGAVVSFGLAPRSAIAVSKHPLRSSVAVSGDLPAIRCLKARKRQQK
jgi:hypothetical protein